MLFCLFLICTFLPAAFGEEQQIPIDWKGLTADQVYWINLSAQILAIIGGLLWVFAGYKLFRSVLFVAGSVVGFFTCYQVLGAKTELAGWLIYVISAGAALLGGFLFTILRKLGVFLFGFLSGALLGGVLLGSTPITNYFPHNWISLVIVLGLGLIIAFVALWLEKPILIVGTSFSGSYVVGTTISQLVWGQSAVKFIEDLIANPMNNPVSHFDPADWKFYAILGGIIGMAIIGILVQFFVTAKNYDYYAAEHKQRQGQDGYEMVYPARSR